jgi:hypothetical protein
MEKNFKSVVFFQRSHPSSESLLNSLKLNQSIKIFQTHSAEEIVQIIPMSDRTAIICDGITSTEAISSTTVIHNSAVQVFFIDWDRHQTKQLVNLLSQRGISTLTDNNETILEKIEFFLFGKIRIFSRRENSVKDGLDYKPAYFTLFKIQNDICKPAASSHEKEKRIDEIIGSEWEELRHEVLCNPKQFNIPLKQLTRNQLYVQLIHPHYKDGTLEKISIVHIYNDESFEVSLNRVNMFLKSI